MHVKKAVKVFCLKGKRRLFYLYACIVDKDIHPAKPVYNGIHQHGNPLKISNVTADIMGALPNFPARMFQFLFPSPNQDHGGIGTGQALGHGKTKTGCPACDDGNLSLQVKYVDI